MGGGKKRLIVWLAVAVVALTAIVASEIAKKTNTHDYSSRRSSIEWPARLTLDRSDLAQYLRYQFNVEAGSDAEPDDGFVIRAGWCQLAGRERAEASDLLAAEATLRIAQQPWFDGFVRGERPKLHRLRDEGSLSLAELREHFIDDLAMAEAFRRDFPRFIEEAAAKRDVHVRWLPGLAEQGVQ